MLRIKVISEDIKKYYEKVKNHSTDSGFDIYQPDDIIINPHTFSNKIKLGISTEFIENNKNKGYYLVPRSSISKTPLRMSNSIGIIDADYRGELIAVVDNLSDEIYIINKGDRLFQIINPTLEPFEKKEIVDELSQTIRNDGGFGSTGK